MNDRRCRSGFTLVELLVAVAVIALLIGVLIPAIQGARRCAFLAGETSYARQLVLAYQMYADEHSGRLMPGYAYDVDGDDAQAVARDDSGRRVGGESGKRYPWRLLPYVDYQLGAVIPDAEEVGALRDVPALYHYLVSGAPRFGLNQTFLGGSADNGGAGGYARPAFAPIIEPIWGSGWFAERLTEVPRPDRMIVFARSSGFADESAPPIAVPGSVSLSLDGHYRLDPPRLTAPVWPVGEFSDRWGAVGTGNVKFGDKGKVSTASLDGSAGTLTYDEARDMRRWSPQADAPDWMLPALGR